jgi:hypothetical protein
MRTQALLVASLLAAAVVAAPSAAHAGVGIGLFVGEPTGFTIKADLQRRTSFEVLLGVENIGNGHGRGPYGHFTFLVAPFVARGESVVIPFRLGIGAAVYDDDGGDFGNDVAVAVRAPFELAFQFRRSPLELYLEIALKLEFVDPNDNDDLLDLDGGIGFRIYF